MAQLFSNFAKTTLSADLGSGVMTMSVNSGSAFPSPGAGDTFDVVLEDATNKEIVRVSARVGNALTISARALEGTTSPTTFAATTTTVALRLTAAAVQAAMAHLSDAADAHAASAITNTPTATLLATNVQAALNELDGEVVAGASALSAHTGLATDAHDASAISYVNTTSLLASVNVQEALDELNNEKFPSSMIPSGTAMLFVQTAAPTGWTKVTTHNDKALRVVSGTAGSGGSVAFSSAFASKAVAGTIGSSAVTGTVGNTTLTESQMPSHTHSIDTRDGGGTADGFIVSSQDVISTQAIKYTGYTGGGGAHGHSFTGGSHGHSFSGTAIDMAVQYVDTIIATKD